MDVVLFYPPNFFVETAQKQKVTQRLPQRWEKSPPLGILYLASVLEKNEISVNIIDANALEIGLEETLKLIEKEKPKIVGISATTYQIRAAVQLAKRLKEESRNEIVIGLGGAHVSSDPDFINRLPFFDFGLVGEGEITFPKLVKKALSDEKVKGIFYGEQPTNLDEIPFPARHLVDKRWYFPSGQEVAPILANRGCPYNCIFCSSKVLGRRVRFRSPTNIVDEMEKIMDEYSGRFWFVNDVMTANRDHTLELCKEIVNRKLDLEWSCETRINLVDTVLLKAMHKAGCRSISFGIESGCERVRTMIVRKNFTNEKILEIFRLCKKIGIQRNAYLMLGFPTETREELYETVHFGSKIDADIIGVHVTQLMPGSDLFTYAVKEGAIPNEIYDHYAKGELRDHWPIYIPKGLSLNDLTEARRDAYKHFYFGPRFILRRLVYDMGSWSRLKKDGRMAFTLWKKGKTPGESI